MLPRMEPLNPIKQPTPFDDPDWLFEVKFDGFRALAYIEDGRCELVSRKGHVYTRFGRAEDLNRGRGEGEDRDPRW